MKSILKIIITRRDNLILIPNKLEQIQKLKESFEDGVIIIFFGKKKVLCSINGGLFTVEMSKNIIFDVQPYFRDL